MRRTVSVVITIAVLFIIVIAVGFFSLLKLARVDRRLIKTSAELPYTSDYNLAQTNNDCGPYSCALVVRLLTKRKINMKELIQNMEWRLPNHTTLPWGLEKLLKGYGIKIQVPFLLLYSIEERINYLKAQLSFLRPIILLGVKNGVGHYITLLGFKGEEFYVYDSWHTINPLKTGSYTRDENGMLPGNLTLSARELADFWKGSENFFFFPWYALVTSL
jgi:hypothetical protein